jgi:hypothetical protein
LIPVKFRFIVNVLKPLCDAVRKYPLKASLAYLASEFKFENSNLHGISFREGCGGGGGVTEIT